MKRTIASLAITALTVGATLAVAAPSGATPPPRPDLPLVPVVYLRDLQAAAEQTRECVEPHGLEVTELAYAEGLWTHLFTFEDALDQIDFDHHVIWDCMDAHYGGAITRWRAQHAHWIAAEIACINEHGFASETIETIDDFALYDLNDDNPAAIAQCYEEART